MDSDQLKRRTKNFALQVIHFVEELPTTKVCDVLGKQLLRCGTSVGANYRSACRAKSPADFISKMRVVEEEADESSYWIELFVDYGIASETKVSHLLKEANGLTAIAVSSIKTARSNLNRFQSPISNRQSSISGGVTQAAKGDRL